MPYELPQNFGDATKSGESSGFTPIRGVFEAAIFKIDPQSHKRKGDDVNYYSIDFRINGGEFDGEDIKGEYVGLYADAIFTLHDILVAIGELDKYYQRNADGKGGKWVALPSPEDLQGKKLYIQVDNAQWQSADRETKVGLVHQSDDPTTGAKAGTPILRDGNGISAYFPIDKPKPEYRPRTIRPNLRKVQQELGAGITGGSAFPGQVTGVAGGGTQAQDVWGGSTAQQPGTSAW